MIVQFHVGFIVKYDVHRLVVLRGVDVAARYLKGSFVIDALAIAAIIPELISSTVSGMSGAGYKTLYLFRLLRLLRVARMMRGAWGVALLSTPSSRAIFRRVNTATFYLMNIIFVLAVIINVMGCMWWFLAELEGLENSWVVHSALPVDLLNTHNPARWVASVYFAVTVITTVGFGDITPATIAEMAVAALYMLVSLFYFGYVVTVVGTLLGMISSSAHSAAQLQKKLEEVEMWMKERHIPPALQHSVRRYYSELWAPHGGGLHDAQYFSELPVALRGRIVGKLAGEAIQGSHMLRTLSPEVHAYLAQQAQPMRLMAGHVLYDEWECADRFWVLQEGEVRQSRGMHVVGSVHAPAMLGQEAVFSAWIEDCREHMHTVHAVTSCTLWEFNSRPLQRLANHHPGVLRVLCEAYRQHLATTEERLKERGFAKRLPKRLPRINKEVERLLQEAARAEEEEAEERVREGGISVDISVLQGPSVKKMREVGGWAPPVVEEESAAEGDEAAVPDEEQILGSMEMGTPMRQERIHQR